MHLSSRTFLGPSQHQQKKRKQCDIPSGLADTYQRNHKKSKPGDAPPEPIKGQIGEVTPHGGDQVNAGMTNKFGGFTEEQEKKWEPARAQSTKVVVSQTPKLCTNTNVYPKGPMTIAKIVVNAPQERLQHSAPIANATTVKN